MSTTLQQFIDEFLQGNDNPEISTALSQEFDPPPEPSPGPLMDPRAAAALSALGYNEAVQDLHHAGLIEVGCARLRLGYDTATPHAGFQVLISSGTRRARFAGLDRLMYREDIRKLLDRWVPWSCHVDTVPPPPGALAVRWSSVEHMRTYARNARAA